MNNWRLLLALVAVFQPIASFTQLSNVDGREHCCDRRSGSVLRETKSPFHGSDVYPNTDQRREIQEVRRSDLRLHGEETSRFRKEAHLLRHLERDTRERVSPIRSESRSERTDYGRSRERLQVTRERLSRDIPSSELNRNVYRSRDLSRENERQQQLFRNINDERVARFTSSQQSRRDTPRIQVRSRERQMGSADEGNSARRTRDSLVRFETSNTFNSRRQLGRESVRQREPVVQDLIRRENTIQRSSDTKAADIRNMRSLKNVDTENSFNSGRYSNAQRTERRSQRDSQVFRERTNFAQRSIHDRETRKTAENRDNERYTRERQNERNADRRERREESRRFRENQRENINKVRQEVRMQSENPRLFIDQRIIRSENRRSIQNLDDRFDVNRARVERRSERRGSVENGINREVRRVRDTRFTLTRDSNEVNNNGQNRVTRREVRNDERRSSENRREIRDVLRLTRDERSRELRDLARDSMRRFKDYDEQRREKARAIRTESRSTDSRERIIDVRSDRAQLNRFGNERVNELKRTERRSVESISEDRRDMSNDVRRNNDRILEIRNKPISRDSRVVKSNERNIMYRVRLSRESGDKVDNRMTHSIREERIRDIRREVRYDERRTRDSRGMVKASSIRASENRRTLAFERDNVLLHRARSEATLRRDNRSESIRNRLSTLRDKSMDFEKMFRTRESSTHKMTEEAKGAYEAVANWQYVLYALQGIYLCGLLVQMLSPTNSKNAKSRIWWLVPAQKLIKAD